MINDKVYSIGHKHGKLHKLNSEPYKSCCLDQLTKMMYLFGIIDMDILAMTI